MEMCPCLPTYRSCRGIKVGFRVREREGGGRGGEGQRKRERETYRDDGEGYERDGWRRIGAHDTVRERFLSVRAHLKRKVSA